MDMVNKIDTDCKVGDRVLVTWDNCGLGNIIEIHDSDSFGIKLDSGRTGFHSYGIKISRSSFILVSKTNKKIKLPVKLLVKGHEPKLVIKIGCKEFDYKTANALAQKLLKLAKTKKELGDAVSLSYSNETFSIEDIENFLKWYKQQKLP